MRAVSCISNVTDEPRSPTTSQPNMTREATQEKLNEQEGRQGRKTFPWLKTWMQRKRTKPLGKAPGVQQERSMFTGLKIFWMRHKRMKPLGKAPDFRRSIIAIIKTSSEPLRPLAPRTQLTNFGGHHLGMNMLLVFIPLSVSVSLNDDIFELHLRSLL
jgi:hypothetical protein